MQVNALKRALLLYMAVIFFQSHSTMDFEVAKNQRIQEVQMRQLIQEELRKIKIEHAESNDCRCVIS